MTAGRSTWLFLAALSTLSACVDVRAAGAALPCVKASRPPVIDAELNEPCWAATAAATPFVAMGSNGGLVARRQSTVRTCYDRVALYLSAVCFEPEMARIQAAATARDGPIFDDDCLEISLGAGDGPSSYRHYAFNAIGTYYDGAAVTGPQGVRVRSGWNSEVTVAAKRLDDRWVLEVCIPFAELGVSPPEAGDTWVFNAAREHRLAGRPPEFSTWSALPGTSFHQPLAFACLRFTGDTIDAGLRSVSNAPLAVANPDFSQRDADGQPLAWELGPGATCSETAYLSGVFEVTSAREGMLARQAMNAHGVADREYEVTVVARGTEAAAFGLTLSYEDSSREARSLDVFRNASVDERFGDQARVIALPRDARRVTGLALAQSSRRGSLSCRAIRISRVARDFREVKDAAEHYARHRLAVGVPFASPCTAWAAPLHDGPLRVLCIVEKGGGREVVELGQRLDMQWDLCRVHDGTYLSYQANRVNARLRREEAPYDVIILTAPIHSRAFGQAIRTSVSAGTGFLYVRPHGEIATGFEDVVPRLSELGEDEPDLARTVPWRHFPPVPDNQVYSGTVGEPGLRSMGVGTYGQGRVVRFGYGRPGRVRGLLPHTGNNPTPLPEWWECMYRLIARSAVFTAGRDLPAELAEARVDAEDGLLHVEIRVHAAFRGAIAVTWHNESGIGTKGGVEEPIALSEAGDSREIGLRVPSELLRLGGLHLADLSLRNERGQAVDWRTTVLEVEGAVRIGGPHPFGRDWLESDEQMSARVQVESRRGDEAELSVSAELVDSWARRVWTGTRTVSVAAGGRDTVLFTLSNERCIAPYHTFRVTVSDEVGAITTRAWPLYLPWQDRNVWDDFRLGLNADYFHRTPTDAAFTRWFRELGFGFATEGGVFDSAPRLNMPWHDFAIAPGPFHFRAGAPVRDPCLSDPEAMAAIVSRALRDVELTWKYGPAFFTIADEVELTRDGRSEVCFSEHCTRGFREWARQQYGGRLDRLNAEWGTAFESWDEAGPIKAEAARERGNYAQWVDFRVFMETVWVSAFETVRDALKARFPDARLSFSNPFGRNPFSGEDHYRTSQSEDVFCKYMRPDVMKEFRSFRPEVPILTFHGYLEGLPFTKWYPWWFALNGGDVLVWWCCLHSGAGYDLFDETGRHTPRSLALLKTTADLRGGIGKILNEFAPEPNEVAVLHSQTSLHVAWIESDMRVGQIPWAESGVAGLPMSNPFGAYSHSVAGVKATLKEAGLQPDFLAPEQIVRGILGKYRLLVLPYAVSLSDEVVEGLSRFVADGGTVLADVRPGVYSAHGRALGSRGPANALFGIERERVRACVTGPSSLTFSQPLAGLAAGTSLGTDSCREHVELTSAAAMARHSDGLAGVIVNEVGKGRAVLLNAVPDYRPDSVSLVRAVLSSAGVRAPVTLSGTDGPAIGYERFAFERGGLRYLGVLRDMPPLPEGARPSWFGPAWRQADSDVETVHIGLSERCHVYDVRAGTYLGRLQEITIAVPVGDAVFLGLMPYRVAGVRLTVPASCLPGERLGYQAEVLTSGAQAGDHVLRVAFSDARGQPIGSYSRNVLASGGVYDGHLPLALSDPPGRWRLEVTDVTSGLSQTQTFQVAAPLVR